MTEFSALPKLGAACSHCLLASASLLALGGSLLAREARTPSPHGAFGVGTPFVLALLFVPILAASLVPRRSANRIIADVG
ncbi:MAG: hypothetical protein C4320_05035, partial [Armatimonadota bacterium]